MKTTIKIASGIVLAGCGVALASHFAPKARRACETCCAQMDKCCARASLDETMTSKVHHA